VAYYAWQGIVQRLEQDPLDDMRWQYAANGIATLRAQFPLGSGFGSFRDAYAQFEPVAEMGRSFALHAHNDVLETAIEGGLPGALLLIAGIGLIAWAAIKTLASRRQAGSLAIAASIAAAVPLLHSLVDYPLRTLAIATGFGLVLAVLFAPAESRPIAAGGH
jgi:O-antigen ligase